MLNRSTGFKTMGYTRLYELLKGSVFSSKPESIDNGATYILPFNVQPRNSNVLDNSLSPILIVHFFIIVWIMELCVIMLLKSVLGPGGPYKLEMSIRP